MGMRRNDTILAVASPPGRSPRGIIRVSGPNTDAVVRRWLADDQPLTEPRQISPVRLASPPLPAMLLRFESHRSYTGEHSAELQVPGNPALLDRLIRQVVEGDDAPARLAEAGEFTFRAFTHGKIDLTRAEGIAATIAATGDAELRAASLLRGGDLGRFSERLVDRVATLLALVEAGIDFTDQEDVTPITPAALDAGLCDVEEELRSLLARSRSWGSLTALPRVVLTGPPSSGKSTLFNTLLGRERAVVDEAPGTTRDALEESLTLRSDVGDIEVTLVDVAGVDDSPTPTPESTPRELAPWETAARDATAHADVILAIRQGFSEPEPREQVPWASVVCVVTKMDLFKHADVGDAIAISAHTGQGLDELRRRIVGAIQDRNGTTAADMLALQPRHQSALAAAVSATTQTRRLLVPQLDASYLEAMELVAGHLRDALDALASLGGRMSPDDVIGRVFAMFCVGK